MEKRPQNPTSEVASVTPSLNSTIPSNSASTTIIDADSSNSTSSGKTKVPVTKPTKPAISTVAVGPPSSSTLTPGAGPPSSSTLPPGVSPMEEDKILQLPQNPPSTQLLSQSSTSTTIPATTLPNKEPSRSVRQSALSYAEEIYASLKTTPHASLITDLETMASEISNCLQAEPQELLHYVLECLLYECYEVCDKISSCLLTLCSVQMEIKSQSI